MRIAIGIDTGGTCTDAVAFDFTERRVVAKSKTLTTKEDLSIGISKALDMLPAEMIRDAFLVSLSTTLATNACVENKGGRAGLVLFGMDDELMERLKVEETYGIKKGDVRCVDTKSAADGSRIDEPDWDGLFERIGGWIRETDYMAAAELYGPSIGFPSEKKFKALIKEKYGLDCVCAGELTDKVNVIQRGATALLNARLLPIVQEFIEISIRDIRKRGCNAPIMVVRSDGSLMSTDATAMKPVETILSGPAASILSGRYLTEDDSYMVVDMGGTTTDVSIVRGGLAENVSEGISVGSWKTSVDGVFVDTFALGGDSTVRCVKGKLQLFARRCIPLCTAASRFPQVTDQLKDVVSACKFSRFPLYEFLYLLKTPEQRYNQQETALIGMLRNGPLSLYELSKRGVDLYSTDTTRLEDEGVMIRFGLTPTDFMHITGDYTEFNEEASRLALEYVFNENRTFVTTQFTEAAALALCKEAYNIVEEKLYVNLVRIMLMQDHGRKLGSGLDDKLEYIIKSSWEDFRDRENSGKNLNHPRFNTDMQLLGVGAPTHVFLPEVAKALGTSCVLPENAEIGNAIGAVMAELVVSSRVEITQWNDFGMYYIVHDQNGGTKYESLSQAEKHAAASATEAATKEARLRGAGNNLSVQIIKIGNSHGNGSTENLTYGGNVIARIRFSLI